MTPQSRTDRSHHSSPSHSCHSHHFAAQQAHQINMPQDLRRTIAKNQIERQKAPRSKWQAAGARNASRPPVRSPILIGGDSFIQTPEDLRDLLRLESVPPSIQTIETDLWPMDGKEEHEFRNPDKKPVSVCDVDMRQWLGIQKMTEGEMPVVWFQGKKRLAWLATAKKQEESAIPTENK